MGRALILIECLAAALLLVALAAAWAARRKTRPGPLGPARGGRADRGRPGRDHGLRPVVPAQHGDRLADRPVRLGRPGRWPSWSGRSSSFRRPAGGGTRPAVVGPVAGRGVRRRGGPGRHHRVQPGRGREGPARRRAGGGRGAGDGPGPAAAGRRPERGPDLPQGVRRPHPARPVARPPGDRAAAWKDYDRSAFDPGDKEQAEFLDGQQRGLALLREAAAMPQASFDRDLSGDTSPVDILVPELPNLRHGATLLAYDALARATRGDAKGAIDDVAAIFGIARHIQLPAADRPADGRRHRADRGEGAGRRPGRRPAEAGGPGPTDRRRGRAVPRTPAADARDGGGVGHGRDRHDRHRPGRRLARHRGDDRDGQGRGDALVTPAVPRLLPGGRPGRLPPPHADHARPRRPAGPGDARRAGQARAGDPGHPRRRHPGRAARPGHVQGRVRRPGRGRQPRPGPASPSPPRRTRRSTASTRRSRPSWCRSSSRRSRPTPTTAARSA